MATALQRLQEYIAQSSSASKLYKISQEKKRQRIKEYENRAKEIYGPEYSEGMDVRTSPETMFFLGGSRPDSGLLAPIDFAAPALGILKGAVKKSFIPRTMPKNTTGEISEEGIPVFHGTLSRFSTPGVKSSKHKGHGSVFGEGFNVSSKEIADLYGRKSAEKIGGKVPRIPYYVNEYRIPSDYKFIDLDVPIRNQPKEVSDNYKNVLEKFLKTEGMDSNMPMGDFYTLPSGLGRSLDQMPTGYKGVKYKDDVFGIDRGEKMPTHPFSPNKYKSGQTNYVIRTVDGEDRFHPSIQDLVDRGISPFEDIRFIKRKLKLTD